jgi:hypothetical protein
VDERRSTAHFFEQQRPERISADHQYESAAPGNNSSSVSTVMFPTKFDRHIYDCVHLVDQECLIA